MNFFTKIFITIISFSPLVLFSQNQAERDFVVLTFEMDRNKNSHGVLRYYWIAELIKSDFTDEYKQVDIFSVFLHEFYSSDQLDSCCSGKVSYPYTFLSNAEFDFPKNYWSYLENIRKLIKDNRKKIQTIRKKWYDGYKEKVTVYATAIRGKICECEFGGDRFLTKGDKISFPKGNYQVLPNYLTKEKRILLFKDFSGFDFTNTDYRTGK